MSVIAIAENLTIEHVAALRATMQTALTAGDNDDFVLDLAQVVEFDGAGMQLLLAFVRCAADSGKAVALRRVPEPLARSLAEYGLSERFSLEQAA